jgi:hypothetical protein
MSPREEPQPEDQRLRKEAAEYREPRHSSYFRRGVVASELVAYWREYNEALARWQAEQEAKYGPRKAA